jgi:hypothetical protein
MSISLSVTVHYTLTTDSGKVYESPTSKTVAKTLTLTSEEVENRSLKLATAASVDVWDKANSPLTEMQFVYILSDQDVFVELNVADGEAKENVSCQKISAGVPCILTSDDAYDSDYVQMVVPAAPGGGAVDTIDRIAIYNTSGSEANIDVFVAH